MIPEGSEKVAPWSKTRGSLSFGIGTLIGVPENYSKNRSSYSISCSAMIALNSSAEDTRR